MIAGRLLAEVSTKQGTPREIGESTLLRQQAFTLFVRAYDEARRAVSFLRWRVGNMNAVGGPNTPSAKCLERALAHEWVAFSGLTARSKRAVVGIRDAGRRGAFALGSGDVIDVEESCRCDRWRVVAQA